MELDVEPICAFQGPSLINGSRRGGPVLVLGSMSPCLRKPTPTSASVCIRTTCLAHLGQSFSAPWKLPYRKTPSCATHYWSLELVEWKMIQENAHCRSADMLKEHDDWRISTNISPSLGHPRQTTCALFLLRFAHKNDWRKAPPPQSLRSDRKRCPTYCELTPSRSPCPQSFFTELFL